MGRAAYIRRRLILMAFVLFGVTVVIFGMVRFLPGYPAFLVVGDRATEQQAAALRGELGLNRPFPVPDCEQARELYRWLSTERPGPIVELPFGFEEDYRYVYFTTVHWLPLVNGLSSFAPTTYDEVQSALRELPTPRAVDYAAALGIKA